MNLNLSVFILTLTLLFMSGACDKDQPPVLQPGQVHFSLGKANDDAADLPRFPGRTISEVNIGSY